MHSHLDFGHGIAHEPKVQQPDRVESLARAALKNVVGGKELVDQAFTKKQLYRDLLPKKAENQLMYPPHP